MKHLLAILLAFGWHSWRIDRDARYWQQRAVSVCSRDMNSHACRQARQKYRQARQELRSAAGIEDRKERWLQVSPTRWMRDIDGWEVAQEGNVWICFDSVGKRVKWGQGERQWPTREAAMDELDAER